MAEVVAAPDAARDDSVAVELAQDGGEAAQKAKRNRAERARGRELAKSVQSAADRLRADELTQSVARLEAEGPLLAQEQAEARSAEREAVAATQAAAAEATAAQSERDASRDELWMARDHLDVERARAAVHAEAARDLEKKVVELETKVVELGAALERQIADQSESAASLELAERAREKVEAELVSVRAESEGLQRDLDESLAREKAGREAWARERRTLAKRLKSSQRSNAELVAQVTKLDALAASQRAELTSAQQELLHSEERRGEEAASFLEAFRR